MHKAPTHASGLLMTGPYADTLTAMSNYFKYTGEGQSWADLWEGARGGETEGERHLKRGRGEMGGKRNTPRLILDYVKFSAFFLLLRNTLSVTSERC